MRGGGRRSPAGPSTSGSVRERLEQRRRAHSRDEEQQQQVVEGAGAGGPSSSSISRLIRQARATGQLNLSSRHLSSFPAAALDYATSLEPDEKFWEVTELTRLDISHNDIATLPDDLDRLGPALKVFLARHNRLSSPLPAALRPSSFPALTHLDLSSNCLTSLEPVFPAADGDASAVVVVGAWSACLKELNLSSNQLTDLPPHIGCLSSLEVLHLSGNRLPAAALPPSLGTHLQHLHTLTLADNQLTQLPPSVSCLCRLRLLDASKNSLHYYHDRRLDLSGLGSLTHLDLRQNRLEALPLMPMPPPDGTSNKLSQLYLGMNRLGGGLGEDEEGVERLVGGTLLAEIDLQSNGITAIPTEFGRLCGLKVLDVSNNDLSDVPACLGHLPALHRLLLEGNPIRTIRRNLLTGGPISELKKFLQTRGPAHPALQQLTTPSSSPTGTTTTTSHSKQPSPQAAGPTYVRWVDESMFPALSRGGGGCGGGVAALTSTPTATTTTTMGLAADVGGSPPPPACDVSDALMEEAGLRRRLQEAATSNGNLDLRAALVNIHTTGDKEALLTQGLPWLVRWCLPWCAERVRSLDLSCNGLPSLPDLTDTTSSMPALTHLDLASNNIASVPASSWSWLCSLPLATLILARNPTLPTLPPPGLSWPSSSCPLSRHLQHLDLTHCSLSSWPCLTMLPLLHTLLLAYNRLTSLTSPPSLPHLAVLDVSNNRLTSLGGHEDHRDGDGGGEGSSSSSLWDYPSLTSLNLENNDLKVLPPWLCRVGAPLSTLRLAGNPQRTVRPDIISKGSGAVLSYLRARLPPPPPSSTDANKQPPPSSLMARGGGPSPPAPAAAARSSSSSSEVGGPPSTSTSSTTTRSSSNGGGGGRGTTTTISRTRQPPPWRGGAEEDEEEEEEEQRGGGVGGDSSSLPAPSSSSSSSESTLSAMTTYNYHQRQQPLAGPPVPGSSSSSSITTTVLRLSSSLASSNSSSQQEELSALCACIADLEARLEEPALPQSQRAAIRRDLARKRADRHKMMTITLQQQQQSSSSSRLAYR